MYHRGRPLQTPNPLVEPDIPSATWLSFNATSITVPGIGLVPGMDYRLEVEIAKLMDTDKREGVVGSLPSLLPRTRTYTLPARLLQVPVPRVESAGQGNQTI